METPGYSSGNGENSEHFSRNHSKENGVTPGVLPLNSTNRSRRKQWVLHDGPHGSLQRLRLRMAEEGCGHSQVALAKQLLSENSAESDQIAVHWLIKAADQGHYEGLELLKNCFETNRGITEQNYLKIRSFLEMSQHERAARIGAKNLFSNMAQGSDFITIKQLESWLEDILSKERVLDYSNNEPSTSCSDSSLVLGGELISEQHMVSAASVYACGHFPPLLRLIHLHSKKKLVSFFYWLRHCIFQIFTNLLLLFLAMTLILLCIVLNNFTPVMFNLKLSYLSIILIWSLALASAVLFTAQSCRLLLDWNLFQSWSILLSQHTQQLQPAIPEYLYISRSFPPHFGRFLLAAIPCVSLQPVLHFVQTSISQSQLWIPYGELGVLATLLCSACWPSMRYLWAIAVEDGLCLAAWILVRNENLPWETNEIIDRFLHFQIHPAFSIGMNATTLLGLFILIPLYIRRVKLLSSYTHLIAWFFPHLVSLMWLFLAIEWFQLATYDGILRGLMISSTIVLFRSNCNWLTKANLLLCCITSYFTGSALGLTPWIALSLALILIGVVKVCGHLVACFSERHFSHFDRLKTRILQFWTLLKSALLVACLAILLFRLHHYFQTHATVEEPKVDNPISIIVSEDLVEDISTDPSSISWEQYKHFCHDSSWTSSSVAATQTACSSLGGVIVQWEGKVRQVTVATRWNTLEYFLKWLPNSWTQWINCQIGEKWAPCDLNKLAMGPLQFKRCQLLWRINQQRGIHCHIDRFSKYTFRIEVEPSGVNFWESKPVVELIADANFQQVCLGLTVGDIIRFSGSLSAPTVGGIKPEITLDSLECTVCRQGPFSTRKDQPYNIPLDFSQFAVGVLQGTVDFVFPHFVKLNVSQLLTSD